MQKETATVTLEDWEIELLNVFVGLFDSFGVPKSVAQIYGVLFCADGPLSQEEIGQKLQISAGSASQGLRLLVELGAAHRQSVPGQRGNQFTPERSMRRLLGYFIDAKMRPRMRTGKERLEALRDQLPPENKLAQQRLESLLQWQDKANKLLPLISKFLG
jgi:DNA-binding transcriptional regulator GbsR (MarR family)